VRARAIDGVVVVSCFAVRKRVGEAMLTHPGPAQQAGARQWDSKQVQKENAQSVRYVNSRLEERKGGDAGG